MDQLIGEQAIEPSRFAAVLRDNVCAMQYKPNFAACQESASLIGFRTDTVDVLRYRHVGEQWCLRDYSLIEPDRTEYFVVCAPLSAFLSIQQNGSSATLRGGSFGIVATNRPFKAHIQPLTMGDRFASLFIRMPAPLMRGRIPSIDNICGRENHIEAGNGRFMMSLLDASLNDGPYMTPSERERLGQTLFDVIGNVAMTILGNTPAPQKPSSLAQNFQNAKSFIASHLSDAELNPAMIADHCRVSTRYLHAAFAAHSAQSVSQFIRDSRLQACRQALRDPKLQHRTVLQIAGSWGFDDPTHFGRIYKSRFGRCPSDDRSDLDVVRTGRRLHELSH